MTLAPSRQRAVEAILAPRSVAIVGASADPEKLSGKLLDNLLRLGFAGPVYPVNPRAAAIAGLACYPSMAELPATPDLAFLVLPAPQSVAAAWECARRGVAAAVVAVSGFREAGTTEGAALEDELQRITRETGMRILGPNCNGVYNARLGISLGYNAAHADVLPSGPLSVISHSGALFSALAGRARALDLGFGAFVSLGNEADLGMLDFLEWTLDDPACRVIGLVVEAIRDGARFRDLVQRARGVGKHVVALKLGTSSLGQATTSAHSSRLAGSARAYAALFAQSGAAQVATPEGLVTAAMLLSEGRASGRGLAGLTTSGAGGAILADTAARFGVPFAELSADTLATLDRFRRYAPVLNPADVGATGPESTEAVAGALAADPNVGAVVLYATLLLRAQSRANVARGLCAARASSGKPVVVLAPGGLTAEEEQTYRAAGIRLLHDTAACFEGLAALLAPPSDPATPGEKAKRENGERGKREKGEPEGLPSLPLGEGRGEGRLADPSLRPQTAPDRRLPAEVVALLRQGRPLTEPESSAVLRAIGVPVVEGRTVQSEEDAIAAAIALGWPVVLKGVAVGAVHKSDLGLVLASIADEAGAQAGFRALQARATTTGIQLDGVLVQPQRRGRLEALLGLAEEPGVGQVLIAGLGGVYAEALEQTRLWVVPASADQLRAGLRATTLGRVLESPRWPAPDTLDQLVALLLALQALALDPEAGVAAVDVNPLLLGQDGPVAVDALVIPRRPTTDDRRPMTGAE